jgi:hypothetical protein
MRIDIHSEFAPEFIGRAGQRCKVASPRKHVMSRAWAEQVVNGK